LACALSAGGFALGLSERLPKRRVLYCALEDGLRRLQARIRLLGTSYDADAFQLVTRLRPIDRGGLDELRTLIRETHAQVVFIDVVARILPQRKHRDSVYQADYDTFAMLKDLAECEGITIVGIHHENKNPSSDPLLRVSGSTGVTGAIDAVLSLNKKRGEQMGTLFVTGRDIEKEAEYAITFTAGRWYLEGDARQVQMSEERREILRAIEELGGKAKATEIAQVLGKNPKTTYNILMRMRVAGDVHYDGSYYTIPVGTTGTVGKGNIPAIPTIPTIPTALMSPTCPTGNIEKSQECDGGTDADTPSTTVSGTTHADNTGEASNGGWQWQAPKRRGVQWRSEHVDPPPEQPRDELQRDGVGLVYDPLSGHWFPASAQGGSG